MKCKELVDLLDITYPGLARHKLVPILTHYWFTGRHIVTYNEVIGMSVPYKSEFKGAAPALLLDLLQASRTNREVDLSPNGTEIGVFVGEEKRGEFPFLDESHFSDIFTIPKPIPENSLGVDLDKLRDALRACLLSFGYDISRPDLRGITIIPKGKQFYLYSTNNATLSRAILDVDNADLLPFRVILPREFCETFVALTKEVRAENVHFEINDQYALAVVAKKVRLYGRLIVAEQPTDFEGIWKHFWYPAAEKEAVTVPDDFRSLVDRAIVVSDAYVDKTRSELSVKNEVLSFYSESIRGVVDDEIQVKGHPDVRPIKLLGEHLKAGLDLYDRFLLRTNTLIMLKDSRVYMIATTAT